MDFLENLLNNGKCCITGRPLTDCKQLNIIDLQLKATWAHPVHGNLITGTSGLAMAIIHDDQWGADNKLKGEIKYAIETNDADDIFYHPVDKLEKA